MKLETIKRQDPLVEETKRIKRKTEIVKQMEVVRKEFERKWSVISKNPKTLEEERKRLLQWKRNLYDSFNKELDEIAEAQKKFGNLHQNN